MLALYIVQNLQMTEKLTGAKILTHSMNNIHQSIPRPSGLRPNEVAKEEMRPALPDSVPRYPERLIPADIVAAPKKSASAFLPLFLLRVCLSFPFCEL